MKKTMICALLLLMVACSEPHHKEAMKTQLDNIRVMIKQSALMAVNAACAGAEDRNMLIHAAAVMDRRAMGGPEMARIHKMMNMQPDASGSMAMKKSKDDKMSAEMLQHVALHDAGEDVFDFLDGVDGQPGISCEQATPASMAAAAAVLREAKGKEPEETARKLDENATRRLADKKIPDTVRALARALQKI